MLAQENVNAKFEMTSVTQPLPALLAPSAEDSVAGVTADQEESNNTQNYHRVNKPVFASANFKWEIKDFLDQMDFALAENRDQLSSDIFCVTAASAAEAGSGKKPRKKTVTKAFNLQLKFYPNSGYFEERRSKVGLFLCSKSKVCARFSAYVLLPLGGKIHNNKSEVYEFQVGDKKGWSYMFNTNDLRKKGVLCRGALTLVCEVKCLISTGQDLIHSLDLPSVDQSLSLGRQLQSLKRLRDVTIEICPSGISDSSNICSLDKPRRGQKQKAVADKEGCEFTCHKAVLEARSDVFSAMFQHQETVENQTSTIRIEDMDARTAKLFLDFLYTDDLPQDLPMEQLFSLLTAADKYNVACLKQFVEREICRRVGRGNISRTIDLAETHHSEFVQTYVVSYLAEERSLLDDGSANGEWWKDASPDFIRRVLSATRDQIVTSSQGLKEA